MKHIYTSIDIGSDTMKVIVAELYKGKLNLLAASSVKSKGIKKGLITDVEQATISLRKAVKEVEEMLGIRINKAIATISSYFADFVVVNKTIKVESEDGVVTGSDVQRVLEEALKSKDFQNKEIVTILPIDFALDDKVGIKDPKRLVGSMLSVRAVVAITPKKNIYSVVNLIDSIGIEVVDISLTSIGDIYSFRNKDIDSKVGAIINIGSETTTVSLYNKGIVVKSNIIGMGGKNVENDIAYMYKIDANEANKIKENFALAHKKYASVNELYELDLPYEQPLKINQFEVSEIVMSRIEEILSLASKEIATLTNRKMDYIIVTGGLSNMAHFEYIVADVLGKDAIVGNVKMIGIRDNKYSSCIGNIVYFINKLKLKGKNYTMIDDSSDLENILNVSNESMLGKVFGYFFGE